eukprot:XP_014782242.1 PREDICTED: uncharacterized protein LOC106877746 [Octopus bimaculoides]
MSQFVTEKANFVGKRHSLATLTEIWSKHQNVSSSSPRSSGQHYANRVSSTFTNLIGSSSSIHSDTPQQQGSLQTQQLQRKPGNMHLHRPLAVVHLFILQVHIRISPDKRLFHLFIDM